jgi:glycosyltransferase involved in cell wall biosynthesis
MKKKVLVEGPILTQSGYGEHARFVLRSLRSQEDVFDIYAIPLNWGKTSWIFKDDEERKWIDSIINKTVIALQNNPQFDIYAHVGIANELKRKAAVTIEITAGIESNKVAPEWLEILNRECDKIITISEHSKEGLVNTSWKAQDQFGTVFDLKLQKPVEVVGYPVKQFNKYTEEYAKEKISLDYDFNFLCVAQWGPRKNLENTIRWFVEEFRKDKVGLVCKVNQSNNSLLDRERCDKMLQDILASYPSRVCKVYLLHGDLNDDEVHNLYVHPQIKAIVNFGHGEGFGLPLYEAAYCGLPVIAPDFSGHKDFLYGEVDGKIKPLFSRVSYELRKIQPEAVWNGVLHPESEWAYVKPLAARLAMRELYKDHGRFKGQAKKLRDYILNKDEDVYHKMAEFIYGGELKRYNFNSVKLEQIPKISFITSVYKGEEFIEGFMEDITKQSIFKEKCELILVNCNSPENEEKTILKYKELYPDNIKYIKLDHDPGIYGAWNLAIKESTGEYVSNANLDDRHAVDFAEKFAKLLVLESSIDCVYTENLITVKPNETFTQNTSNGQVYPVEEFSLEAMLRGNPPHCMPMWRKSLHEKNGYFEEKYKSAGDWDFWLRCTFANSKFLKYTSEPLGLYYFNSKGISTNQENDSWKKKEEFEIFKKYQKLYLERNK